MNLDQYEKQIAEWDLYPVNDYQRLYYTIGMNGESCEFLGKYLLYENVSPLTTEELLDLVSESGDICWYFTRLMNSFGFSLQEIYTGTKVNSIRSYVEYMGKLTESIKKLYRDNNGVLDDNFKARILLNASKVFERLDGLLSEYHYSLQDAMESNIIKLSTRKKNNTLHGDGDKR